MSSFKNSTAGAVVSTEVASYEPMNFDNDKLAKPVQSFSFIESHKVNERNNFEIDPRISETIGLTEAKKKDQQKRFDGEVLRYVQKIKDDAYQEAYNKGLEEGKEAASAIAYKEAQDTMLEKLKSINQIASSLATTRDQMFEVNEKEIVQFCYYMAEKIVFRELKQDPSLILSAIKAVAVHQDEVTLKVSNTDYAFLQPNIDKLSAEMNIEKVRIERDEKLKIGDLIVESQQGHVDGTIETRLKKLKSLIDGQE